MRNIVDYMILDDIGIKTANFTAATTDIITSNAHGLKNSDMVVVSTTTTLPAGLAASTVYWVIEAATNTFKLSATPIVEYTTGLIAPPKAVDITSTGTGTHTFTMHDVGKNINVRDFRHAILSIDSDGGTDAEMTVKFQGSIGKSVAAPSDSPDFSAAQSPTNSWDYIEVIDLEDGGAINGDTGIIFAAADDNRQIEMNVNGLEWINCIISGWVAGEVTVKVRLFNN